MSSYAALSDIDLKSKLARYGIYSPITNSTRQVLINKLHKLEKDSMNNPTDQQITTNDTESMVIIFTQNNNKVYYPKIPIIINSFIVQN